MPGASSELPVPLVVVGRVLRSVARRHRLSDDEAEELRSLAYLKLLEDRRVFGRFEGRSSVTTYLSVVLQRLLLDQRFRERGKWRASAVARRHGAVAVRLERLIARDGLTRGEAVETLVCGCGASQSRAALGALALAVPARPPRRYVSEEVVLGMADPAPSPEERVAHRHLATQARATHLALRAAVAALPPQERAMLAWRFRDGHTIAEIAHALGLPAKRAYRYFEQVLRRLRRALEASGAALVARELVREQTKL